jgi:hypothetical protein
MSSHVKEYIKRVASIDQEQYPEWDLQVCIIFKIPHIYIAKEIPKNFIICNTTYNKETFIYNAYLLFP